MNPSTPQVSVIIPAYNREKYLGPALQSVLDQTRPADEIIVVDDGSSDGTVEVARSFGDRVRCLSGAHGGASRARNLGVHASRGDLLAFLDSDDLWVPEKLENQCRHLDLHAATDMVFGHLQTFLSPEFTADTAGIRVPDTRPMPGLCAGTMLIRRPIFEKIGDFDPEQRGGEFIEWFSRAQDLGCTSDVLPGLLLKRRAHQSNTVLDRARMNSQYARILKTVLDRRRAAQTPG